MDDAVAFAAGSLSRSFHRCAAGRAIAPDFAAR
jgi:hypothetical protein